MRAFRHWRWHLYELFVRINGETHYLWRAIDHEGEILESYVTKSRGKKAVLAFMKNAVRRHGSPEKIILAAMQASFKPKPGGLLQRCCGDMSM